MPQIPNIPPPQAYSLHISLINGSDISDLTNVNKSWVDKSLVMIASGACINWTSIIDCLGFKLYCKPVMSAANSEIAPVVIYLQLHEIWVVYSSLFLSLLAAHKDRDRQKKNLTSEWMQAVEQNLKFLQKKLLLHSLNFFSYLLTCSDQRTLGNSIAKCFWQLLMM